MPRGAFPAPFTCALAASALNLILQPPSSGMHRAPDLYRQDREDPLDIARFIGRLAEYGTKRERWPPFRAGAAWLLGRSRPPPALRLVLRRRVSQVAPRRSGEGLRP